jgi:hypothetical protein
VFDSSRPGELRLTDLKDSIGNYEEAVDVVVRARTEPTWRGTVAFTQRWAGRGWQTALACPRCGEPSAVLRLAGGELVCNRCRPHRTLWQREHRNASWRRLDGELEAALLRGMLTKSNHQTSTRLKMREWAARLLRRDEARVETILAQLDPVLGLSKENRT